MKLFKSNLMRILMLKCEWCFGYNVIEFMATNHDSNDTMDSCKSWDVISIELSISCQILLSMEMISVVALLM